MPGLVYPLVLFTALYVVLAVLVTWLMVRQIRVLHRTYRPHLTSV
jgi:cytochrome bd-type quinol oxidase subunit 1